jgi:signal transduction histidine kinase
LHICRHIVAHHGGELWVESRPGAGACFSFTLPIQLAEASVLPAAA